MTKHDTWIDYYHEVKNFEQLSTEDRDRVIARLYCDKNEAFGQEILQEFSKQKAHVPTKRKNQRVDDESTVEILDDQAEDPISSLSNETYDTESYTGGSPSYYADSHKTRKYTLTFYELDRQGGEGSEYLLDDDSSLDERLLLSSIGFTTLTPKDSKLNPVFFAEGIYQQVRQWQRCIKIESTYFPPLAVDDEQLNLNTFLTSTLDTVFKSKEKKEIDLISEDIAPFLRYLFPSRGRIEYAWEAPSFLHPSKGVGRQRHDFIMYEADCTEIGCGEVKVGNVTHSLLENDRARIIETMKRQMHVRIFKSKGIKEIKTFGIFCNNYDIELYVLYFVDSHDQEPYNVQHLQTLKLPTTKDTYTFMGETLEYILGFKNLMLSSLPNDDDQNKPLIHQNYSHLIKPTISFIKEKR
ncbi:unnamed protein product [Rhizopus stolonifer]